MIRSVTTCTLQRSSVTRACLKISRRYRQKCLATSVDTERKNRHKKSPGGPCLLHNPLRLWRSRWPMRVLLSEGRDLRDCFAIVMVSVLGVPLPTGFFNRVRDGNGCDPASIIRRFGHKKSPGGLCLHDSPNLCASYSPGPRRTEYHWRCKS
jgi:hypothetical protein